VDTPETVTDAVRLLENEGFRIDGPFAVGSEPCHSCGQVLESARLIVRRTFRFEGASDPGDEAIVLGVECPACGAKGIVVSAYGADADAALIALVSRLRDARTEGSTRRAG